MSLRIKAHLALFVVALIYGANYIIAKDVMVQGFLTPKAFIWLRVTGATLLFFLLDVLLPHQQERIQRKDIPFLLISAFFGVAANQLLFFMGLERTSPINASIIMITTPVIVLILAAILLKERVRNIQIVGIIFGALGAVLLILSKGNLSLDASSALGNIYVLLNAISYATYLVTVRRLMASYRPLTVIKWIFFIGWFYVSMVAIPDVLKVQWSAMSGAIVLSIGYVILFTTFTAYLLTIWAIKQVSPKVVGAYIYLQPAFATLFSFLFTGELIRPIQVLAAFIVGIGVYMVGKKPPKR